MSTPNGPEPRLPLAHLTMLATLHEAGGAGSIDKHGFVHVAPSGHTIPGDAIAWLKIVAAGYLAGEEGRLILTQEGRDRAAEVVAGRTRSAPRF